EWNQAMSNSTFVNVLNLLGNTIELNYVITSSYPSRFYTSMAEALTNIWNSPLANQTGLDQPMKCALGGLLFSDYINASINRQLLVYLAGWTPDFADPDDVLFPLAYHEGLFARRIGYNNSLVNSLYQQQKTAVDKDERDQILNVLQETMAYDFPYLWLAQETEFRVWRASLRGDGLIYNPMHEIYFYETYKISDENPTFPDPLRFYLLIGISIELVTITTLIVHRVSKRKKASN
ncbi:MAG: hypothetical protein ACFFDQ_14210, partial [Candidatus Thorarchaeota archaeon]